MTEYPNYFLIILEIMNLDETNVLMTVVIIRTCFLHNPVYTQALLFAHVPVMF